MGENITVGLVEHRNKVVTKTRGISPRDVPPVLEMTQHAGTYIVKTNAGHIVSVEQVGENILEEIREFEGGLPPVIPEIEETPQEPPQEEKPKPVSKRSTSTRKTRGRPRKTS